MLRITDSVDGATPAMNGGLISGAIIKENMRRLWPAGLVSFFVYFTTVVIPIIFQTSIYEATDASDDIEEVILSGSSFLSITSISILGIICAIIIPVAVFRYLHSQAAISVAHVLPLRRVTLYMSNLISGLILVFVPALINIALVLIISRKYFDANPAEFILAICTILLFTYAATTLAGMVSGNSPMHILTALVFNFAWILLFKLAQMHIETMFFGLDFSSVSDKVEPFLNPFSYFLYNMGDNIALGIVIFAVVSIVIFLISYILYRSVKAERAGDSLTFKPVEWIFISICTFGGMFLGGFMLGGMSAYNGGLQMVDPLTYISPEAIVGDIFGMVIAFIVAVMIVRKRANIFNMNTLRKFGVLAITVVVFMVFTTFDITGVKERVPEASEVASGAMTTGNYTTLFAPYFFGEYLTDPSLYIPIRGEEDVKTLSDFHRSILNDKGYMDPEYDSEGAYDVSAGNDKYNGYGSNSVNEIKIDYRLKNGQIEARKYDLSWLYLRLKSEDYAKLMASESVKNYFMIKNHIGYDCLLTPDIVYSDNLNNNDTNYKSATPDTEIRNKLTGDALAELAACIDKDYLSMTAEDMMNPGEVLFSFDMQSKNPAGKIYPTYESALSGKGEPMPRISRDGAAMQPALSEGEALYHAQYMITDKSVNTIAWLKEKGIYDSIMKTAAELKIQFGKEYRNFDEEDI